MKKNIQELFKIEGLGPKKIKKLFDELNIENINDLKKALQKNKIKKLAGFGEKTEQNIIQSLSLYEKSQKRMLISDVWFIANNIINYLKENCPMDKIDIVGSIRRMKETIGDIDLLACTKNPKKLMNVFIKIPQTLKILAKGDTKTSIILKGNIQIDLRIINKNSYGAALISLTGSKEHTIKLRKLAENKGYKFSEYGLTNKKNNKIIASKTEEEIYNKLGFEWIPPELRENKNEFKYASKNMLPKLIQLKDIKGDLQMHTIYSDGLDSIKDMVKSAKNLGYDYIAITDHSKSERIANGMDEKTIKKQWQEIKKISKLEKFKILKGAEVNIMSDGNLDYDDNILKTLDIILVAIHSGFKSNKNKMTERILKGLSNKYVNIFIHPTGRLINKREGYNADFDKIFKICKKNNIALEINCSPDRLDLNDQNIIKAKKHKVKFSLGTDAHNKNSLKNIIFGIGQAKRGWLEKKNIINTMTYKQLIKFLKK